METKEPICPTKMSNTVVKANIVTLTIIVILGRVVIETGEWLWHSIRSILHF